MMDMIYAKHRYAKKADPEEVNEMIQAMKKNGDLSSGWVIIESLHDCMTNILMIHRHI